MQMGDRLEILTSYILWLTLGWFGAHHLYLGRDRHAFVWFWTGGGFLLGWICELWRIPDYVRSANGVAKTQAYSCRVVLVPAVGIKRFLGEIAFSCYLGCLAISALPGEIVDDHRWLSSWLSALAVAVGVHTVANIGREECKLTFCLIGSFLPFPVLLPVALDTPVTLTVWSSLLSSVVTTYYGRRMRSGKTAQRQQRSLCHRFLILSLSGAVMTSLFVSAFYFNGHVNRLTGGRRQAQADDDHLASFGWRELRDEARRLFLVLFSDGVSGFIHELRRTADRREKQLAYKELDVSWDASESEIRKQYRRLAREFHPDRMVRKSPEQRKAAEERFVAIRNSYEKISGRGTKPNEL